MKKVTRDIVESCPSLRDAYEIARGQAFGRIGELPRGVTWDSGEYGRQVSPKGTLVGDGDCGECGRKVKVTFNLPRIEAKNNEGDVVKLFDSIGGSETIQISGHPCIRERG